MRLRLGWVVLALALAVAFFLYTHATSSDCARGTYEDTTLLQLCVGDRGQVICVISAFEFSPYRTGNPPATDYVPRPEEGPWCANARRINY